MQQSNKGMDLLEVGIPLISLILNFKEMRLSSIYRPLSWLKWISRMKFKEWSIWQVFWRTRYSILYVEKR